MSIWKRLLLVSFFFLLIQESLIAQRLIPENVKANIRSRVDHDENMSIVVGLIDSSGTDFYSYGKMAASNPMTPNEFSIFEIGSITKVFTAIILINMVEQGEISLSDPVSKFLPDSINVPKFNDHVISLSNLAMHNSGLPRMPDNFAPEDDNNPFADYSETNLMQFLHNYTLPRDVGESYEYSNLGMGLLGHILAKQAQTSYGNLVSQRITSLLDLEDTIIDLSEEQKTRLAKGHSGKREVPNWDIPTLAGAGELRSTASDMLRFLSFNLDLLSSHLEPILQKTHQPQFDTTSPKVKIGFGWHILNIDSTSNIIFHDGGTGGYRSIIAFSKEKNKGAVVLTNSNRDANDIALHLIDPDSPIRKVRIVADVDPAIYDRYVGQYEISPDTVVTISRLGKYLMAKITGQGRSVIYPESETHFFYKFQEVQISFNMDEGGEVISLTLHRGGEEIVGRRKL